MAELSHWHYDTFLVTWRDPLFGEESPAIIVFGQDAGARVSGLRMQLNRDTIVSGRRATP